MILASYTFENLRLMWLSADGSHPQGLGNTSGQLGRHYMTKHWNDVFGHFPDTVFNAQSGPAAQMVTMESYASAHFDSYAHGFIGGASLHAENQLLPLQISRTPLPDGVPAWGPGYKDHLRRWQHLGGIRCSPTPSRTPGTSSISTRSYAIGAGSDCRSCASRTGCGRTRPG